MGAVRTDQQSRRKSGRQRKTKMKNEELKNSGLPVSAAPAEGRCCGAATLEIGSDYRDRAWLAAIRKIDAYLSGNRS